MISEKINEEKLLSFSHRAKGGVWKVCFFVGFLRSSFGRIKFMSTVVEREYTPDITGHICFAYQLTGLYDKRFYWTVFPIASF